MKSINLKGQLPISFMTEFIPWTTKAAIKLNAQATLFHTMKVTTVFTVWKKAAWKFC